MDFSDSDEEGNRAAPTRKRNYRITDSEVQDECDSKSTSKTNEEQTEDLLKSVTGKSFSIKDIFKKERTRAAPTRKRDYQIPDFGVQDECDSKSTSKTNKEQTEDLLKSVTGKRFSIKDIFKKNKTESSKDITQEQKETKTKIDK